MIKSIVIFYLVGYAVTFGLGAIIPFFLRWVGRDLIKSVSEEWDKDDDDALDDLENGRGYLSFLGSCAMSSLAWPRFWLQW